MGKEQFTVICHQFNSHFKNYSGLYGKKVKAVRNFKLAKIVKNINLKCLSQIMNN